LKVMICDISAPGTVMPVMSAQHMGDCHVTCGIGAPSTTLWGTVMSHREEGGGVVHL